MSKFVLCPRKKKGKWAPMLNAAPPTHGRTRSTVDSVDTGSQSADRRRVNRLVQFAFTALLVAKLSLCSFYTR